MDGPAPLAVPDRHHDGRGFADRPDGPSAALLDLLERPAALVRIGALGPEPVRENARWRRLAVEVVGSELCDAVIGAAIEAWERGIPIELDETLWVAGRPWTVTVVPWSDDGATTVVVQLTDRLDRADAGIADLAEALASAATVICGFADLALMRLHDAEADEIEDHLRQVVLGGRSLSAIAERLLELGPTG